MSLKVESKQQLKDVVFEVKDLGEADGLGTFEGYAAVFGNVDSYADICEPGMFKRTIENRTAAHGKPDFPILFNHDIMEPIGVTLEMAEDAHGLKVKGALNLNVQRGREVYALIKQGALKGMSFTYRTILSDTDQAGVRHLKEVKLYEWGPVVFPANELAEVTAVKSEDRPKDLDSSELKLYLSLTELASLL